MKRQYFLPLADTVGPQRGGRLRDLRCSGKKAKHVAARLAEHLSHTCRGREILRVADVNGMRRGGDLNDRTPAQILRDSLCFQRRRHDHYSQILARACRLLEKRESKIGMNAPLVELVENRRAEFGKKRVGLQSGGQDPFCNDQEAGSRAVAPLKTHLPADLFAQGPSLLVGNAPGNRTGGDTSRLKQDHGAVGDQGWRDTRRFSGARRGDDDNAAVFANGGGDRGEMVVDRERSEWHRGNCSAIDDITEATEPQEVGSQRGREANW